MVSPSLPQWRFLRSAGRASRVRAGAAMLWLVPPLVAMPGSLALGQTVAPPTAGTILQQLERNTVPRLPGRDEKPRAAPLPEEMQAPAGLKVDVKQFRFAGNTLLKESQLAGVVTPWLGRSLDFVELRKAAAAVADAYRSAGWIVHVYLPRQDITDGVVTLQVIEAVFGAARIDGDASVRLKWERVLRYVDATQKKGAPLSAAAIDRALLLIEDLPGTSVAGSLTPGGVNGETDLVLKMSATPLFSGDVALDNGGSRATGSARATGGVAINNALGLGDQANLNLVHAQGVDYARLAATVPVGAQGWRVGASGSVLRYRLVAPEFAGLNASGTSNTVGFEASYPVVRSRMSNLYLNLNADRKRFINESAGAVTTRYVTNSATVALQGNHFDAWQGGGANSGSVSLTAGKVDLGGSPNQAADAASTRTEGSFTKWRYAASRRQVITQDLQVVASLSGQAASKNLDSSERFYLGGPNGVRAYPVNEGGGSSGQLVNIEARYALPHNFAVSGFYDWGHVTVNRNNDFPGAAIVNNLALKGAGAALGWSGRDANVRLTWARRIGSNPNPTVTGLDQDGSKVRNRIWITAGISF